MKEKYCLLFNNILKYGQYFGASQDVLIFMHSILIIHIKNELKYFLKKVRKIYHMTNYDLIIWWDAQRYMLPKMHLNIFLKKIYIAPSSCIIY